MMGSSDSDSPELGIPNISASLLSPETTLQRIGKLNDSWSMELSPISISRDNESVHFGSPLVSIQDKHASDRSISDEKDHTSQVKISMSTALYSVSSIHNSKGVNDTKIDAQEMGREMGGNPSWFLNTQSTTPLSTKSCDFSLETLPDESPGLSESSSSDDSKPKDPGIDEDKESTQNATEANDEEGSNKMTENIPLSQEHMHMFTAAGAGSIRSDLEPASLTLTGISRATTAPLTEKSTQENESKESSPIAMAANTNQPPLSNDLESYWDQQVESSRPNAGIKATLKDSQKKSSHASCIDSDHALADDLASSHKLDGVSQPMPDTSSLIEDATQKMKKYIHELERRTSGYSSRSVDTSKETSWVTDAIDLSIQGQNDAVQTSLGAHVNEEIHLYPDPFAIVALRTSTDEKPGSPTNGQSQWAASIRTAPNSPAANLWPSPCRNNIVSPGTGGTPGKQDFDGTKKQLGATSFEFIQKINVAAKARTRKITRSRDSLVAKVRDQEKVREEEKALAASRSPVSQSQSHDNSSEKLRKDFSKPFKARFASVADKIKGRRRLSGVPNVMRQTATIPSSPLLGSRRPNPPRIKALQEPVMKPRLSGRREVATSQKNERSSLSRQSDTFKARPAPATTGDLGRGGQSGLPKVPKRPSTIPISPFLGLRRRPSSLLEAKENQEQPRRVSTDVVATTNSKESPSVTGASPMSCSSKSEAAFPLLGLEFLSVLSECDHQTTPVKTVWNQSHIGFVPSSTQRAQKRAEFESRRAVNEQLKRQEDLERREQLIRTMNCELDELREVI